MFYQRGSIASYANAGIATVEMSLCIGRCACNVGPHKTLVAWATNALGTKEDGMERRWRNGLGTHKNFKILARRPLKSVCLV